MAGTLDGGIILVGTTSAIGRGTEGLAVKLSSSGIVEWSKEIGTVVNDELSSVVATSDGGFAILGRTLRDGGQSFAKVFLMKLDSDGTELWNFYFNQDSAEDFSIRVLEAPNGDLIIAGEGKSIFGGAFADPFVAKLSSSGTVIWGFGYDKGGVPTTLKDCTLAPDGKIYLTGTSIIGLFVTTLDTDGTLLAAQLISAFGANYANTLTPTPSGNLLLTGAINAPSQGGFDLFLIEVDPLGIVIQAYAYGNSGDQEAFNISQ